MGKSYNENLNWIPLKSKSIFIILNSSEGWEASEIPKNGGAESSGVFDHNQLFLIEIYIMIYTCLNYNTLIILFPLIFYIS